MEINNKITNCVVLTTIYAVAFYISGALFEATCVERVAFSVLVFNVLFVGVYLFCKVWRYNLMLADDGEFAIKLR